MLSSSLSKEDLKISDHKINMNLQFGKNWVKLLEEHWSTNFKAHQENCTELCTSYFMSDISKTKRSQEKRTKMMMGVVTIAYPDCMRNKVVKGFQTGDTSLDIQHVVH